MGRKYLILTGRGKVEMVAAILTANMILVMFSSIQAIIERWPALIFVHCIKWRSLVLETSLGTQSRWFFTNLTSLFCLIPINLLWSTFKLLWSNWYSTMRQWREKDDYWLLTKFKLSLALPLGKSKINSKLYIGQLFCLRLAS